MATTKQKTPIIDDDFLSGIKAADNLERKEPAEMPTKAPEKPAADAKKVLITAKINESTVKNWKLFCINNDITLTDAIKRAMTHYIKAVQSGTIEI